MAIYIYETIPARPGEDVKRYELQQSMKDAAFEKHPETGEPIRRVITGGVGFISAGKTNPSSAPSGGCHGGGCGCH
jgi:predicted nucleic acid-binding Zn ribbon protein